MSIIDAGTCSNQPRRDQIGNSLAALYFRSSIKISQRLMLSGLRMPCLSQGSFFIFGHFIFISSVKEEKGAAFIDQRPAHPDETFRHKSINERGVLVPQRLLPRALRNIAIGTG